MDNEKSFKSIIGIVLPVSVNDNTLTLELMGGTFFHPVDWSLLFIDKKNIDLFKTDQYKKLSDISKEFLYFLMNNKKDIFFHLEYNDNDTYFVLEHRHFIIKDNQCEGSFCNWSTQNVSDVFSKVLSFQNYCEKEMSKELFYMLKKYMGLNFLNFDF